MSKILRICACVFALVFVVDNAWAACAASTKRYTSCKSGYYLNGTGAGNSCTSCTTVSATDLSQSCSRSPTSTELNNANAYAGSISGAKKRCAGKHTGGAGGTSGSGSCTGCSSWEPCAGGSLTISSCKSGYYKSGNSCPACTGVSATDLSQSCSRNPTSTELSNAHAYAGTISGAKQQCTGKHTGGAGGTSGSGSCTGCSSWGSCSGGTLTITSCAAGYYKYGNSCKSCPSGYTSAAGTTGGIGSCYMNVPAGKYIKTANSSTQTTCEAGYYCPGGKVNYGSTGVRNSCPDLASHLRNSFPDDFYNPTIIEYSFNSWATGKSSISQCQMSYRLKNDRSERITLEGVTYNSSTERYDVGGRRYYVELNPGYYLIDRLAENYCDNSGNAMYYSDAQPCPAGSYCPGYPDSMPLCSSGTYNDTMGINTCPGEYPDSAEKSGTINQCYAICSTQSITGGNRVPVSSTVYYGNNCEYTTVCNDGYNQSSDGVCSQLCGLGFTTLRTGSGLVIPLYSEKLSSPAIHIGYNGGMCYGILESGSGDGINLEYNGQTYHTGR